MNRPLAERSAGVLLHPSSLPGSAVGGGLGGAAHQFLDLVADAGLRIWQVLPLGPTHADGCPYQAISVHAGNPDLIDLDWLREQGWLSETELRAGQKSSADQSQALDAAAAAFTIALRQSPGSALAADYRSFLARNEYWLEDYVRYRAFREDQGDAQWTDWPEGLRHHVKESCDRRASQLAGRLDQLRFREFVFDTQWRTLRQHARERGVFLFGDMPIFVHLDSADVWADQGQFDLDSRGRPITVTGVPPDYFSEEGQLWGNPQYKWDAMQAGGFDWWLRRFETAARQFDMVRIDHFRALEAYWRIPAAATSARDGEWVSSPGADLLRAVRRQHPDLCLVAENLGTIGPEVEALRRAFDLPGMLILQFAFDGNPENPYLSHRHEAHDIVYTGTHDNDTSLGWFQSLDENTRQRVYDYFGNPAEPMPWMLIQQAMASPARTAIVPWQDFLGLDGSHRMNTPGTTEGNWEWRFDWSQVPEDLPGRVRDLLTAHARR